MLDLPAVSMTPACIMACICGQRHAAVCIMPPPAIMTPGCMPLAAIMQGCMPLAAIMPGCIPPPANIMPGCAAPFHTAALAEPGQGRA